MAALLAGFGGLAAELAMLRRLALGLGNTAESSALGTGAFVLGLGLGSWFAARRPALVRASFGYALVAVGVIAADLALAALRDSTEFLVGGVGLLLMAGLAAVMGAAFTGLFRSGKNVALIAPNLLGSVLAAAAVGNLVLPEHGPRGATVVAAIAYGLAAGAARLSEPSSSDRAQVASATLRSWSKEFRIAGAAGAITLGYEVLLFRRLTFFLEGFLPTLTGVLVAVLLVLALGALLAGLLTRFVGRLQDTVAPLCLTLGAVLAVLPFLEVLAPSIAETSKPIVAGTFTMHLRIWIVACVAALPVLPLGAVVPLLVAAEPDPLLRESRAGALWCANGFGALVGALLVGQVLPMLAPTTFFVVAPGAAAALVAVGLRPLLGVPLGGLVFALALLGSAGAGSVGSPRPPVLGSRFDHPERYRYLSHRTDSVTTASVVYDQGAYGMALFTDEFPAAYVSPTSGYMKALAHLPMLLHPGVKDACVICLGTGTTLNALMLWPDLRTIAAVELSPAVLAQVDRFGDDGPVATGTRARFRADARVRLDATDGRHFLARAEQGSLDLVTMEPLLPYAPGTSMLYSKEFYAIARGALREGGVCVQWLPTHAMPREMFRTLLATFAAAFPESSLWLFDRSTLIVGWKGAPIGLGAAAARFTGLAEPLRVSLQEAALAALVDLEVACLVTNLGAVVNPYRLEPLSDERPWIESLGHWSGAQKLGFFTDNLAVLAELVRQEGQNEAPALESAPELRARATRLQRLDAWTAPFSAWWGNPDAALVPRLGTDRGRAQGLRSMAPESLFLWREERMIAESFGGAVRGDLRGGRAAGTRGVLEDLGRLPSGAELVAALRRGDSRSAAYRSAFAARAASALIEQLAKGPLNPQDLDSLATVVDPGSLVLAIAVVTQRAGSLAQEILPLLRPDLALPQALLGLGKGKREDREAFASVLGERKDATSLAELARLLLDSDPAVRTAAGAALFRTVGQKIRYDPLASESERREAARQLTELHNPRR